MAAYGVLPVSFRIPLATAGALNVTVKDMALSGLNTWLKMVLGSAGPHGALMELRSIIGESRNLVS